MSGEAGLQKEMETKVEKCVKMRNYVAPELLSNKFLYYFPQFVPIFSVTVPIFPIVVFPVSLRQL